MISIELTIETQFYDLDPMGIVWHGNYVRFFEQARCCLLNKIGYNYEDMRVSGFMWPVVDMRIKYVRSLRFPQSLVITSSLVEYENRLTIGYVIHDKEGNVLTKASTTQVAVDAVTGELHLESPSVFVDKVKAIL